jgi:hypothetical protein
MQTAERDSLRRAEESLRVVVVYEDTATHLRALHTYDYLVAHAGTEIRLQFSWWSFDLLREARRADEAARMAAVADLVIFSTRPAKELPAEIKAWLASWTARRAGRPGAIAALFSSPRADAAGTNGRRAYLQGVAKNAGMDFLAHEAEPLLTAYFAELDGLVNHTAPPGPLYQDAFDRPDSSPYWGING